MAGFLKPSQHQRRQQRPDVQAVAGRIKAAVQRSLAGGEPSGQLLLVGRLMDQATPAKVFEERGNRQLGVESSGCKAKSTEYLVPSTEYSGKAAVMNPRNCAGRGEQTNDA